MEICCQLIMNSEIESLVSIIAEGSDRICQRIFKGVIAHRRNGYDEGQCRS